MTLKPFRPGRRKSFAVEASPSAAGVEPPSSLVFEGSGAGVEVPVFSPVVEDYHAKAAREGPTSVASLPVAGSSPLVTGSSSPTLSIVVAVPSSDFGSSAFNIAKIHTPILDVSAIVSGSPAVAVIGLEPLGVGDLSELSVQGRGGGSVPADDGFGSVSAVQQLSQFSVEQDPSMAVRHSLPAKVSDDTNYDTFSRLSVQDKAYMDPSTAPAL
jgi:hypothetical protein